jgi:hypothetical protein
MAENNAGKAAKGYLHAVFWRVRLAEPAKVERPPVAVIAEVVPDSFRAVLTLPRAAGDGVHTAPVAAHSKMDVRARVRYGRYGGWGRWGGSGDGGGWGVCA